MFGIFHSNSLRVINRSNRTIVNTWNFVALTLLELDRYIGNTHHRGRLWDNWNHRQMMTISDQSVPMFHDDVTHWIRLAMGSIGHLCRTIQGSARYLPLMTVQALREVSIYLRGQTNNPCSTVQALRGSLIKLFFYYLVGPTRTIIVPGLD